ncbi:kinase D-interacting substrate of 220 kDa-like [Limulus polyphemus]|uniref:Kinase D-interacting substrate of 220 kDa-like n=1 Tax=Limulus polyphemus TaxID=6850 RepID=A0ABM1SK86_LIMPO|nr:kinase D-interacting substrate of 220 kDa-like [Limulus polyphemus]
MNIVYITGRLLKAFNIDFNWYHLASWINITEQWPYRTSWIILYYEAHESELEDNSSLKAIYEKVKPYIPVSKEVDPMLDFDHDERKFEVVLSFHTSNLLVGGLKIFLPFTINLDPYIRKKIQEEHLNLGDITRLEGQLVPRGHHTHNSSVFQVFPPSMWPTPSLSRPSKDFSVIEGQLLTMRGAPVGAAASNSEYSTSSLFREKPSCWQLGLPQTHTLPESIIPVKTNIRNWEQVFKNQRLSTLSVDGIISLLDSLEGVDDKKLCTYKEQLSENNINGLVLLTCDLSELKRVLRMSFGDWELFRQLVLALRENEYSSDLDRGFIGDTFSHSRGQSERRSSPPVLRHSPVGDEPSIQTKTTDTKTESSHVTEKEDSRSVPRSRSSSSALEKQVTMEETMIFGALETLNEEAQEDTLQEKYQSGEHRDSVSVTTHSPNPLSPIMSDPEEGLQDSQSDVNESVASVPASFTYPSEINVMYLKTPPHGSPITRLMTVAETLFTYQAGGSNAYLGMAQIVHRNVI